MCIRDRYKAGEAFDTNRKLDKDKEEQP